MEFSGVPLKKLKVAFFEFTSCEGCQLQIFNNEKNLPDFLELLEIINFREVSSAKGDDYEIAFIEGSVSRSDEIERLKVIRDHARMVVTIGACAGYGGVNMNKNRFSIEDEIKAIYPENQPETMAVQKIKDVIKVDYEIPGCPISKKEFEEIALNLALGSVLPRLKYPVCVECKQNMNHCFIDRGELCFGSITHAGCNSICTNGNLPCYGCRGPAAETNWPSLKSILLEKGIPEDEIKEKLNFFNALHEVTKIEN